ncbi:MAG: hypothetical protein JO328_02305 [Hyphomicrobiales bacterium]|nr:hypothetical protein [Hyphomicrobiales bacterium]MBV8826058.1 hypothetical protein [Hyphomicrobiales bacterium]MBV9429895.1 hypothetical protein [Bradyrhizobiaceae bacterium]
MARRGNLGCTARPRRLRFILTFLTFALLGAPVAAQNQDPRAAAEQAIQRLGLQADLPHDPEQTPLQIQLPPEALWLMVAIGLGLLLYMFRDMIPAFGFMSRGDVESGEEGIGGTVAKPPEQVLAAADDLARQGRFVDAMHVLLLQGLADIRRHLGEQFADSLTSREILRSTKLSEAGREPLRDIVRRVEWTYFGKHPAEREDYLACRASFDALAHALYGRGAA